VRHPEKLAPLPGVQFARQRKADKQRIEALNADLEISAEELAAALED